MVEVRIFGQIFLGMLIRSTRYENTYFMYKIVKTILNLRISVRKLILMLHLVVLMISFGLP